MANLFPHELTALLQDIRQGKIGAETRLIEVVYPELRRLAQRFMLRERQHHTLLATELVNEVYLKLQKQFGNLKDRAHLFAVFATQMRHFLVDYARSRRAAKRGADPMRISLEDLQEVAVEAVETDPDLLALNEALDRLGTKYPTAGRVVELRFFGGLKWEEISEVLALKPKTVRERWDFARAWLLRELSRKVRGKSAS